MESALMLQNLRLPLIAAEARLDKASAKRSDKDWLAQQLVSPDAHFLILLDLKIAVISTPDRLKTNLHWVTARQIEEWKLSASKAVLLGIDANGAAHFSLALSAAEAARHADVAQIMSPFVDLRSLGVQGSMPPAELAIAGEARALAAWHDTVRCCGRCGSSTVTRDAGWRRHCGACGLDIYPRADPAVIMLVSDGERCLLGHEHRFPDKFYSVLAGFVEAGDDIEHAVRREVMEETGVRIGRVTYAASQPWPFPHALMIGCWAEALSTELTIDPTELTDARWVDREEVRAMLEGRHPDGLTVPPPISMAHSLIRAFAG